jgi:hypothetical protein
MRLYTAPSILVRLYAGRRPDRRARWEATPFLPIQGRGGHPSWWHTSGEMIVSIERARTHFPAHVGCLCSAANNSSATCFADGAQGIGILLEGQN